MVRQVKSMSMVTTWGSYFLMPCHMKGVGARKVGANQPSSQFSDVLQRRGHAS